MSMQIALIEPDGQADPALTLSERFIVPPFSVLEARQGYWQDRKREWSALGIQSEIGRGDLTFGEQNIKVDAFLGGKKMPRGYGERNMAFDGGPMPEGVPQIKAGTSIFDPVLCELVYSWFSAEGGKVFDPFAGGSVRGIVAAVLERSYTGIDLRQGQIAANAQQAHDIVPMRPPRWICGDSRDCRDIAPGDYDLLFSCPPYGDLEVYSDNPLDLSTQPYPEFIESYRYIIRQSCLMLNPDSFACFVVGDFRDGKGMYRNFVSDTIAAFRDAGLGLYNEAILVTTVGSLPIRVGKQFTTSRKLGKTHQNVLVFVKGDPRKATEKCGTVKNHEALELY